MFLLTQGRYQLALSTIQRVMKDDERLFVYALYNLVQVFISLSNPDGEMTANELLHQVCISIMHMCDAFVTCLAKIMNFHFM